MAVRVFYSWQSDRSQNRNFIRSALDAAIKELHGDISLEEAKRDVVVDQDTQGVPGSPAIADTILAKIRSANVFVADLTFMPNNSDSASRRETPNPNVLLEFGYALHALGDSRIIGVFNETYGSPNNLPFDLAHRRWPIRFRLDQGNADDRQKERKALSAALKTAIRSIITQFDEQSAAQVETSQFIATEPGDGIGRLRGSHDFLCFNSRLNKPVWLRAGPYSFLRVIPTIQTEELGDVEAYKICQAHLQPIGGMRSGGGIVGRHPTGAVSYWTAQDEPELAWAASEIFLSRELWANDYYLIHAADRALAKEHGFPYIPMGAFEEVFIDAFINFVGVAINHLKLTVPLRVVAGAANVQGVRLAVDPQYFAYSNFEGMILRDNIIWEETLTDWPSDPFDFLLPFFKKIYDIACITRPDVRTTGRRQH